MYLFEGQGLVVPESRLLRPYRHLLRVTLRSAQARAPGRAGWRHRSAAELYTAESRSFRGRRCLCAESMDNDDEGVVWVCCLGAIYLPERLDDGLRAAALAVATVVATGGCSSQIILWIFYRLYCRNQLLKTWRRHWHCGVSGRRICSQSASWFKTWRGH